MRSHLSMRSGNPALTSQTFTSAVQDDSGAMTIGGTVNKTAMSLLLLMVTASYTWGNPSIGLMMFGIFGGLILLAFPSSIPFSTEYGQQYRE